MAREIPEVVRAAAGLAATVLDEARKLPTTLPGVPVRVVGLAMQKAMWLQQQYSGLVARGDELFTGLRGDDEPGMATFDDDEPLDEPAEGGGYRESAFDRAADLVPDRGGDTDEPDTDEADTEDPGTDYPGSVELPDELVAEVDLAPSDLLEDQPAVGDALAAEEVLEELAIAELVDDEASGLPTDPAAAEVVAAIEGITAQVVAAGLADGPAEPVTGDADALENALLESDADTEVDLLGGDAEVDVLTASGDGVTTEEGTVTDEGIAVPEPAAPEPAAPEPAAAEPAVPEPAAAEPAEVATDEGGSPVAAATGSPTDDAGSAGSPSGGTAPVAGYDDWSIAQLRGRLRGYAATTVESLLAYEEATRAREPYLRMLRNRLEKIVEQEVAASPLAPRGV